MVQKLFSGKDLVGRRGEEVKQLQLLRRHLDGMAHIDDGIVGQVYDQIGIFHVIALLVSLGSCRHGRLLITAEHRLDSCHQFLRVKGLDHIIIGAQL